MDCEEPRCLGICFVAGALPTRCRCGQKTLGGSEFFLPTPFALTVVVVTLCYTSMLQWKKGEWNSPKKVGYERLCCRRWHNSVQVQLFLFAFGLQDLFDIELLPLWKSWVSEESAPVTIWRSFWSSAWISSGGYAMTRPKRRADFFHRKILVLYTRTCIYFYQYAVYIYIYVYMIAIWDYEMSSCLIYRSVSSFVLGWVGCTVFCFSSSQLGTSGALTGLIRSISLDQVSWLPWFEVLFRIKMTLIFRG